MEPHCLALVLLYYGACEMILRSCFKPKFNTAYYSCLAILSSADHHILRALNNCTFLIWVSLLGLLILVGLSKVVGFCLFLWTFLLTIGLWQEQNTKQRFLYYKNQVLVRNVVGLR
jgi:hypothetical protein